MSIFITVAAFIVIFSLLILIHEWGHFVAARKVGIHVEEFGMGLPPRAMKLWRDRRGTLFSLNWIPFGGFVRMRGEDAHNAKYFSDPTSFISKSKWQRTLVICAGVFMNFLLGIIILTGLFTVGTEPFILSRQDLESQIAAGNVVAEEGIVIGRVLEGSVAEQAGFRAEDVILEVAGEKVASSEEILALTQRNIGTEISYTVARSRDHLLVLDVTVPPEGVIGISIASMPIIKEIKTIQLPVHEAFMYAVYETGRLSVATAVMFADVIRKIVSQFQVSENVAGPVGIAMMTHVVSQQGLIALLKFTALLSISLAVINILPLPALDGGRLLFIIVELIRGRRADLKWEAGVHGIGFVLLMVLIALITYKDIMRIIYG